MVVSYLHERLIEGRLGKIKKPPLNTEVGIFAFSLGE